MEHEGTRMTNYQKAKEISNHIRENLLRVIYDLRAKHAHPENISVHLNYAALSLFITTSFDIQGVLNDKQHPLRFCGFKVEVVEDRSGIAKAWVSCYKVEAIIPEQEEIK